MIAIRVPPLLKTLISFTSTLRPISTYPSTPPKRPSIAPKPSIDIKHIRDHPDLYTQTCLDRNYLAQKDSPQRIVQRFKDWNLIQHSARQLRQRNNQIQSQLKSLSRDDTSQTDTTSSERHQLLLEAKTLKSSLDTVVSSEAEIDREIQQLAADLPNLTSKETPIGKEPRLLGHINDPPSTFPVADHVNIGNELDLIDFAAASSTSGWGWYFLKNEVALLEQALIQYALSVATRHGFSIVSPPSMVFSHIAAACGFQPRDQGGEQQSYTIAQSQKSRESEVEHEGKPEMTLAGTAEIPFAGMKANTTMDEASLPLHIVGASRCYRAEAGARGLETKGLYRVHEFTKVEMFAWTSRGESMAAFTSMIEVQKEILQKLGLHCRILEMPSTDLGASAIRKIDIEAFFPSRRVKEAGWGEVTSASMCTDYQTRRLNTRLKTASPGHTKTDFPYTVNGTALAVPRVLAAILENGWNEEGRCVKIPEVLHHWMHGIKTIDKTR
ncbi:MAG: hypothetical protein L6R40_007424 [Gallowayella cf. fulva]|nr:MAG: hypothetical protein L6R40_007424 [Xanthomendoza cf. fulva]